MRKIWRETAVLLDNTQIHSEESKAAYLKNAGWYLGTIRRMVDIGYRETDNGRRQCPIWGPSEPGYWTWFDGEPSAPSIDGAVVLQLSTEAILVLQELGWVIDDPKNLATDNVRLSRGETKGKTIFRSLILSDLSMVRKRLRKMRKEISKEFDTLCKASGSLAMRK